MGIAVGMRVQMVARSLAISTDSVHRADANLIRQHHHTAKGQDPEENIKEFEQKLAATAKLTRTSKGRGGVRRVQLDTPRNEGLGLVHDGGPIANISGTRRDRRSGVDIDGVDFFSVDQVLHFIDDLVVFLLI